MQNIPGHVAVAHKSCHSCRRSRLHCDRLYPHCEKCKHRGVECLGYEKLFLWTGAIASRGKLAGQTSTALLCTSGKQRRRKAGATKTASQPAAGSETAAYDAQHRFQPPSSGVRMHTLVDPSFQDMTLSSRRYLDYFSHRVVKDLVAHDVGRNPFRDILVLTPAYPLLQEVIVAASATHMCSQARSWISTTSFERREAPKPVLMDALLAKQKALQLMPSAIQNMNGSGGDVLLTAALFLVNVELLESGRRCWKPHLEAAAKLLKCLEPTTPLNEEIRDYIVSDSIIYSILSLTFNPLHHSLHTYLQSFQILPILEKTANSYLCCPPELLNILLIASQACESDSDGSTADGASTSCGLDLLQNVQDVDLAAWAQKFPDESTFDSRLLASSAHQLAAYLYVLQATPSLAHWIEDEACQPLMDAFFLILSQILDHDSNFKATAWPTFVYGATSRTVEQQAWAMDRLRRMTVVFPWGFVHTAIDTLQVFWSLPKTETNSKSWIQILRESDIDFLIV